ncbi:Bug family tripartite tricarboxylate transporter substrate binding protein [Hydrogenophaga sp. BPS33]|uniref:Bug family tripartite tricarboxylate transporter substrate binding protein n=1 Tax=Hydrogenophaga sp. BPS33 TaxID=2651974 RepID=UPI001357FC22|nr:tripartite tricarboxylate transporter substrate binding protein [Hydrogenophaga sp. BPS33]
MTTPFRPNRRQFAALTAGAAATAVLPSLHAQTAAWPTKPVRLVLGFAPGGGSDVMARVLSQPMSDLLGQPVIVENRPGASGNIATVDVARAPADGYTLLFAPTTQITTSPHIFKMAIDPAKDLIPIASVGRYPLHLVSRTGLPFKTFQEFLAYGRANPDKMSFASTGSGTVPHLVAEAMLKQAGIRATHVPYKGSGPALQAMLTGEVDFVIDPGVAFPHVRSGKLLLLATAGSKRIPQFPEVPMMKEAGLPKMDFYSWVGVYAPIGTPAAAMARISDVLSKTVNTPAVMEKFAGASAEGIYLNTPDFNSMIQGELQVFPALVKELNIKADT